MLLDELKRMKEELAKGENPEEEEIEEAEEEAAPEPEEKEPEKEEEKPEPEAKPEEKKEELDNAGYARLRREAAAEKHRAQQLEKEIAELRATREVAEAPAQIPLPPELQSVVDDNRISRAEREFAILENKAKQIHPEYGAVASEYAAAMYQSIRVQNPRKSDVELNEMTKKAILMKAGEYARQGYENPVEEMYHEARELGFTGKSFQKQEAPREEKIEPDLKKVAENRKRSTGMAANNGRSEGLMTLAHAATELTAAEWAKLPASEKKRLMY